MKIGLFIPCYVDQFYPRVGIATLELLEKLGLQVEYPLDQTCCGQPMANSGMEKVSHPAMELFVKNFSGYDYIVGPTGSCVLHIKDTIGHLSNHSEVEHIRTHTYELCEFLTDILKVESLQARFPHRVGLHRSCHGLRGLRVGQSSERAGPRFSKVEQLLNLVDGIELVELDRADECCGFGGTFAITEPAISAKMGRDRIRDHQKHGAEYITSTDMSCLMHLEGLIRRENLELKVIHVAEILNWG